MHSIPLKLPFVEAPLMMTQADKAPARAAAMLDSVEREVDSLRAEVLAAKQDGRRLQQRIWQEESRAKAAEERSQALLSRWLTYLRRKLLQGIQGTTQFLFSERFKVTGVGRLPSLPLFALMPVACLCHWQLLCPSSCHKKRI